MIARISRAYRRYDAWRAAQSTEWDPDALTLYWFGLFFWPSDSIMQIVMLAIAMAYQYRTKAGGVA